MQRIKHRLEQWPVLYRILHKSYLFFALRYISFRAYLNRNRLSELRARRHLREGSDWIKRYWESRDASHRPFLIEKIATYSPISSILEIGCGAGPNLYLLARKFPDAEIRGIEINPIAVQMGNDWLAQEGISNVRLSVGRAEELGEFQDRSFDGEIMIKDALKHFFYLRLRNAHKVQHNKEG